MEDGYNRIDPSAKFFSDRNKNRSVNDETFGKGTKKVNMSLENIKT